MSAASFGLTAATAACCHEHNNTGKTSAAALPALLLARQHRRRCASKNGLQHALVCSCLAAVACYCLATISSNRSSCRHQHTSSDGYCTGGLWPFTGVDAYPARAYDACNMNDFRDIENMACISGCLHSTSGGGGGGAVSEQSGLLDHSRSKRAIYEVLSKEEGVAASTTTASPASAQHHQRPHHDGTGKARHDHQAEVFDEANQHLWRMLLDEIKRTRLSLAESESQTRQADAVPGGTLAEEKADADDMSTTTTTVSSVSGIAHRTHHHHHRHQVPVKDEQSTVERTKSLLLLRMRRGSSDASDCNRCMLEVVNRYNSCTLRQQGGGRAGGSKRP